MATEEEVDRVAEAINLGPDSTAPNYRRRMARKAIDEVRAMDREKLKLSESALHRLTRQSWGNDSPTGT